MKTQIVSFLNNNGLAKALVPRSIRRACIYVAAAPLLLASLLAEPLARNKRLPLNKPPVKTRRRHDGGDALR